MKIEDIYIGTTIDGKDRIFYKKLIVELLCFIYVDLKTKEQFKYEDIKEETLIPFKSMIFNKNYSTRRKVLKTYYANRALIYHVDNIYVGDICKIDWINDNIIDSKREMSFSIVFKDRVFFKNSDDEYIDLITNKFYYDLGNINLSIGEMCVNNLKNAQDELTLSSDLVNKNYVLKKHYNKFNK